MSGLIQSLALVALFIVISQYLARDMLQVHQQAPSLLDYQHKLLNKPSENGSRFKIQPWPKAKQHLVYFFAPWCTICALSQPSLTALQDTKPSIQIIMVALDWSSEQAVKEFQRKHRFNLPIVLGNTQTKTQWQVDAYPSYYFVNEMGEITSKDRGIVTLPGLLARSL